MDSRKNIFILSLICANIYGTLSLNPELTSSSYEDESCTATPHLIESLPYFDKSYTFPCMYAGTYKTS